MADLVYSFRLNRFAPVRTFRQGDDALYWTDGCREHRVEYGAIERVQSYKARFWGSSAMYWRLALHTKSGQPVYLQAAHYLGFRKVEDRSPEYFHFVKQLQTRIKQANPNVAVEGGKHWVASVDAIGGRIVVAASRLFRLAPLVPMSAFAGWVMRWVGPWLRGHKTAQENLRASYPEKSQADIDTILLGMWDNLGRISIEYCHLDRLWDFKPGGPPGRVVIEGVSQQRADELMKMQEPVLLFGAHLANWELLGWAMGQMRPGNAAVVYRPPRVGAVAQEFERLRSASGATLIAADTNVLFNIKQALQGNAAVGVIIDEHLARGIDVMFFGRPCKVSPVFGLFARQFECPIYGARVVRMPNERFRLEVTERVTPPRDAAGRIDVAGTMQAITSIVESWIRENPEQWNWMQRRWR